MDALEALKRNLAECTTLLDEIGRVVNTVESYHDPQKVNWGIVGDFGELVAELRVARDFITGKGD